MPNNWDELSKSLANESLPRRETLRRLGAAMAATILAPLGAEYAQAGKQPKPPKQPKAPKPPKSPKDPCKEFCTCSNKKQLDQCLKACKACGNSPQRLGGSCGNYFCCGADRAVCGDYCADLANDPDNCGACGYACAEPGPNEYGACLDGECLYACFAGADFCNGVCTFVESDPSNCGACGNACPASAPYCNQGVCIVNTCAPGLTPCGDACVDLMFDGFNCGACGFQCQPLEHCSWGVCEGTCIGCE